MSWLECTNPVHGAAHLSMQSELDHMHLAMDACECICNHKILLMLNKTNNDDDNNHDVSASKSHQSTSHWNLCAYFWKLNLCTKSFSFALWELCNQIIVSILLVALIIHDVGSMPHAPHTEHVRIKFMASQSIGMVSSEIVVQAYSHRVENATPNQHFQPNHFPYTRMELLATLLEIIKFAKCCFQYSSFVILTL